MDRETEKCGQYLNVDVQNVLAKCCTEIRGGYRILSGSGMERGGGGASLGRGGVKTQRPIHASAPDRNLFLIEM